MKRLVVICILLQLAFVQTSIAYEYWKSDFSEGADGWQVYLGSNTFVNPQYNNDEYICYTKNDNYNWLFVKLDWFDWSKLYGGVISFDIKSWRGKL